MVFNPVLPPKRGYIEVEICGKRVYQKIVQEAEKQTEAEPTNTELLNILLGVDE